MNSHRILIVENDNTAATRLKNILVGIGYEVIGIAKSDKNIIEVIKEKRAELIVVSLKSDLCKEGTEVCQKIRNQFGIPKIYIMDPADEPALSQKEYSEPLNIIMKPFDEIKLIRTIEMVIHKSQADLKVRESEERYKALFDRSLDLVYLHDFDGNFIDANNAALKLLECTKEEIKNLNIKDFLSPDQITFAFKMIEEIQEKKFQRGIQEYKIKKRNGKEIYIETNGSLIYKNNRPFAIQGIARDITKRKIEEGAASHLAAIVQSSQDAITSKTIDGYILSWNKGAELMYGYSATEAIGKNISVLSPPENPDDMKFILRKLKEGKTIENFETARIKKNGERIFISLTVSPIINIKNQIIGASSIAHDITKHKQAEKALKYSEQKYKDIFEYAPIGIYRSDQQGNFLTANLAFAKILGYSSVDEILKLNLSKDIYFCADEREKLISKYEPLGNAADVELRWKKKNGKPIWIQLNAHTIKNSSGTTLYFEGFVRDIDQRKEAEEEILKLSRAVQQSPASIVIMSPEGYIEYANPKFIQASEFAPDEIIGKRPSIFAAHALSSEEKKLIWNTISSGKEWKGEFRHKRKDGILYWESATISPIKLENKKIAHYLIILQDITERKLQEEQLIKAKEEAEKSDRLKTEFLAQMSHEIRTPLNNILTYTSLLKEEFEEKLPSGLESTFSVIDSSSQRLIRTIELILNLSRIQTGNFETNFSEFDIDSDLLEDLILEFYSRAKMKNLSLVYEKQTSRTMIYGDHYSLSQIFLNLIDNAIKYTEEGEIKVVICNNGNDSVCIKICDTGIGISSEYLPFLFNPFSQEEMGITRHFEGTGLGLALVKKYAEINNAEILVKSEKWKGSEFILTIPGAVKKII